MKKILKVFLLLCSITSYSQEIITYDFLQHKFVNLPNGKTSLCETAKKGDRKQIKVININRFLFKPSISYAGYIYKAETPKVLTDVFGIGNVTTANVILGTPTLLNEEGQREVISPIDDKTIESASQKVIATSKIIDGINVLVASVIRKIDSNNSLLFFTQSYKDLKKLESLRSNFEQSSADIIKDANTISDSVNNGSKSTYQAYKVQYQHLDEEIGLKLNNDLQQLIIKELFQSKPTTVKETLEILTIASSTANAITEKLKKYNDKLYELAESNKYMEMFDKITELKTKLSNAKNFEYTSPEFTISGEEFDISIAVSPTEGNKNLRSDSIGHTFNVLKTVKIDFSTGLVGLFGSSNENYCYTKSGADTLITKGKNSNRFTPALSAFIHIKKRFSLDYAGALSIGAGIDPTDATNIKYMLGYSQFFGKKSLLAISAGIAFDKKRYLKDSYMAEQKYSSINIIPKPELGKPETLTELKLVPSAFIGITYNLSRTRTKI